MSEEAKVEIEMSEEALKTIESVMPPDEKTTTPIETHIIDQNGKVQCKLCNMILSDIEAFKSHLKASHEVSETKEEKPEEKPQRNEKGQFLEGNNASIGNKGGNECDFCKKPVEILEKIKLYSHWTRGKVDGKIHMPWIEELCDEDYLDIHDDTLVDWALHPHDKTAHSEITAAYKRLFMRQKGFLKKRTITAQGQVAGAIFLLKANHGLIETEKKMFVGDKNGDPMEFIITEERKIPEDD